jgi:hypothetical protein
MEGVANNGRATAVAALIVGLFAGMMVDRAVTHFFRRRSTAGTARVKQAQTKRVYFVRHGQALHNVNRADNYSLPRDAELTEEGLTHARRLRQMFLNLAQKEGVKFEAVITSPLLRSIQTAQAAVEGMGVSIEVSPLVSERACEPCDLGTETSSLARRFPELDFKACEDEVWWSTHEVNKPLAVATKLLLLFSLPFAFDIAAGAIRARGPI